MPIKIKDITHLHMMITLTKAGAKAADEFVITGQVYGREKMMVNQFQRSIDNFIQMFAPLDMSEYHRKVFEKEFLQRDYYVFAQIVEKMIPMSDEQRSRIEDFVMEVSKEPMPAATEV